MRLFIFEYANQVSDRYHCGGGLAVIAHSRESAKALLDSTEHVELDEQDWAGVVEYDGLFASEEKVYIFPDAGCC